MRGMWLKRGLKMVVIAALAVSVFGFVVMSLWNWLVPALTHWSTLTFGQALGLLVLCRILFGGFGRGHFRGRMGERMRARFESMSPEEREQFRQRFAGGRCGRGPMDQPAA